MHNIETTIQVLLCCMRYCIWYFISIGTRAWGELNGGVGCCCFCWLVGEKCKVGKGCGGGCQSSSSSSLSSSFSSLSSSSSCILILILIHSHPQSQSHPPSQPTPLSQPTFPTKPLPNQTPSHHPSPIQHQSNTLPKYLGPPSSEIKKNHVHSQTYPESESQRNEMS